MRDQVALVNKIGAFPQTYSTWGNIDFGTVKGITIAKADEAGLVVERNFADSNNCFKNYIFRRK